MRLLLETHIDPGVAATLMRLVPDLDVQLQQQWRGGSLRTVDDDELLTAAYEESYVLVTFDVTTILTLLARRYERGVASPGVIFISGHTFRQSDSAGIARALARFWKEHGQEERAGQVFYLSNR